jgi:hypothetical protein
VVSERVQNFALEFSSQGAPVPLLQELAGEVFRHVGCVLAPMDELVAALQQATAGGAFGGPRRCDVQIRAGQSTVDILVSANGGRIWQGSCARPQQALTTDAASARQTTGDSRPTTHD